MKTEERIDRIIARLQKRVKHTDTDTWGAHSGFGEGYREGVNDGYRRALQIAQDELKKIRRGK